MGRCTYRLKCVGGRHSDFLPPTSEDVRCENEAGEENPEVENCYEGDGGDVRIAASEPAFKHPHRA